jgi:serine/threonine protein kinase
LSESIICPHCNKPHRVGARFCPVTGKQITQPLGEVKAGATPTEITPPIPTPPIRQAASPAGATPRAAMPAGLLTGQLPPNTFLNNRYLILKKLGQGGMAAVYQVSDTWQPGVVQAAKEMSDAALVLPEERAYAIECFQREASMLRTLQHPNLPKVTDFFTEGGKHYLMMEYIPGQTLDKLMAARGAPFSEPEVAGWALQLCDVLHYLHSQNPPIIFRDLKPGNIMLTPQGQVKLIDFGIARFFKPEKTKDTQALGTPGYFAPEATSGQTDARSDIYSLCVTLHQLLTGFDPSSRMFGVPSARSINPYISESMDQILVRGMQIQRDLRWVDTQELRTQFLRFAPASLPNVSPAQPLAYTAPAATFPSVTPGLVAVQPVSAATSRPTTRLIIAAAKLSPWKLALSLVGGLVVLVVATWLLTPLLARLPIDWNEFPIMAVFGALGYAAYPKRGVVFVSHAVLTTSIVLTINARLGRGYPLLNLFLAVLLSSIFMELWVAFLPRIKGRLGVEGWRRELLWLAAMEVLGMIIFFVTISNFIFGLNPLGWFFSALFGVIGWFLGDLLNQYLTFRQTGFHRGS